MTPQHTATTQQALVEAGNSLRALILAAERYRQQVAGDLGVGITETQALSHLHVGGAMGQTELADRLGITTSAATSLVDRLEAAGLAARNEHPHDRRRTIIRLSRAGRTVVAHSDRRFREVLGGLPAARRADAADMLSQLAAGLQEQSDALQTTPRK